MEAGPYNLNTCNFEYWNIEILKFWFYPATTTLQDDLCVAAGHWASEEEIKHKEQQVQEGGNKQERRARGWTPLRDKNIRQHNRKRRIE